VVLYRLGELASAREHFEQSLALYNSQTRHFQAFLSTSEIYLGIGCLSNIALVLWTLGCPDQALKRSHEALARAQELSHAYSLAYALGSAAQLHQFRREGPAGQERAEALIALCSEHGFPLWLAMGTMRRGWALVEQGQREEGIVQLQQGMATYRATGAEALRPGQLATLAWAYGKMGQAEEGLSVLTEALATVNKTGERSFEVELYRLKGTLALQSKVQGPRAQVEREAEECFQKAIEIARKQQAKSLELRAVMSLARLWQQQGKEEEARQMLAEIYGWFTEGFDTKDLQEAKALLKELT